VVVLPYYLDTSNRLEGTNIETLSISILTGFHTFTELVNQEILLELEKGVKLVSVSVRPHQAPCMGATTFIVAYIVH
jgi:hypothetical protein